MLEQLERDKCVITGKNDLEVLYTIQDFPIYPGVSDAPRESDQTAELSFAIGKSSGMIQLTKLIPKEILYENSHNSSFGRIWEEHHRAFAAFINKQNRESVLEIGGGNGRLGLFFSEINSTGKWLILEPSDVQPLSGVKYQYLRSFFDNKKGATLPESYEIDTIVHSHLMEHIYDPLDFVKACSGMLREGQMMIFTLPNMMEYMKRRYSNVIFFEHTYFITEPYIEWLLAQAGFLVKEKEYFGDCHSIFWAAVKDSSVKPYDLPNNLYEKNVREFSEFVDYHKQMVRDINSIIDNTERKVYLFGAHIFSQYLIKFGLHTEKIQFVLDNDPKKQGKRLYGTIFNVMSPSILEDEENALVIVKMGAYTDEICEGLTEINNKIEIV